MSERKEKIAISLLFLSGCIIFTLLLLQGPIAQDLGYHQFSDAAAFFDIPNMLNVVSNVPFLMVGLLGLYKLQSSESLNIARKNRAAYFILFLGTALVSLGSGYYHLWPSNHSLVWDRLPMTMAFMGLFSVVITEFISEKIGKAVFIPLLLLGLLSVVYWYFTEVNNVGDLRLYMMVQFFPILAIPVILLTYSSRYGGVAAYWWLLGLYLLAKVFEHFDHEVHSALVMISGHSIKHILAAVGLLILLNSYEGRKGC